MKQTRSLGEEAGDKPGKPFRKHEDVDDAQGLADAEQDDAAKQLGGEGSSRRQPGLADDFWAALEG